MPHPRRATAGAAGGCILVRRAALEGIGGIQQIRAEVIDDCADEPPMERPEPFVAALERAIDRMEVTR